MRLKNGGLFDVGHAVAVVTTNDIFRNIHANQRNMDKTSVTQDSEINQGIDEVFDTALEDLFTITIQHYTWQRRSISHSCYPKGR